MINSVNNTNFDQLKTHHNWEHISEDKSELDINITL